MTVTREFLTRGGNPGQGVAAETLVGSTVIVAVVLAVTVLLPNPRLPGGQSVRWGLAVNETEYVPFALATTPTDVPVPLVGGSGAG